ncbi:MAG: Ig-like domain-containing protein [Deltaproteobacteria bacterium]|nr:Ig-like domain-containing protein [Deltaproteobacteria bacterium]
MRHQPARLVAALALALLSACGSTTNPDTTPRVASTVPPDRATNVATTTKVTVNFARAMDPSTITQATFTLSGPGGAVSGDVEADANSATFTPASILGANSQFTVTLSTGIKDATGLALPTAVIFTFTTGAPIDTTPPTVVTKSPAANATLVPFNTSVTATFSKAINPNTVTTSSFTLKSGSTIVNAAVSASGTSATLSPFALLFAATTYTVTVTSDVTDTFGNHLDRDTSWTFTTGPTPDTTPPSIVNTLPLAGAIGVPTNASVYVVFSEPMNGTTINTTNVKLKQGSTNVAGAVSMAGNVAVFTPSAALNAGATITLTVKKDVTDLAGNKLLGGADVVQTYTTGSGTDTVAPTFAESAPADGDSGVPLNDPIIARFSEAIAPSTINASTFAVTVGGVATSGTYAFNGPNVVFTPAAPWAASSTVSVALSTGIQDASGNPLAAGQTIGFTTGTDSDTTSPTVSAVLPQTDATGVSTRPTIQLTFSEAMSPLTLTNANISLTDPTGAAVLGDLTYTLHSVSFVPRSALTYGTRYTLNVNTQVKDAAGNPFAAPYASAFTIGGIPDVKINEIAPAPSSGPTGDTNGDEVTSSSDDEFVEILNNTATAVDLSGWVLRTGSSVATVSDRMTFPVGTTLPANGYAVIFGGGTPASFGSALVFKANSSLSLTNSGGAVVLQAQPGQLADSVTYDAAPSTGASWVRSPEGTGTTFVDHTTVSGNAGVLWSPGVAATKAILRVNKSGSAPKPGDTNVANTLPLTIQFNMPVLTADLSNANIKLFASSCTSPANEIALTVTGSGAAQAQLKPAARLANDTLHCLQIGANVHSAASNGAALGTAVQWEFTSGTQIDPPDVKINEIAAKVGSSSSGALNAWGDTNGDDATNSSDDEFIEIINNSPTSTIDLTGWSISTGSTPSSQTKRFTFPSNTTLDFAPPNNRAVVFGKAPPAGVTFGTSLVFASPLVMADGGGTVQLVTPPGAPYQSAVSDSVQYGPSPSTGASWVRSPEGTGIGFAPHTDLSGNPGVLWSPGVKATDAIPRVNKQEGAPKAAAIGVAPAQPVLVQFNMSMVASDLIANVKLYGSPCASADSSTAVTSTISAINSNTTAQISPAARLADNTVHCVKASAGIRSGSTSSTAALAADATYEFTTGVFTLPQSVKINEFLGHPAGFGSTGPCNNKALGDSNGDGVQSSSADEFVELINNEAFDVDVAGWTIRTSSGTTSTPAVKYTFPNGTKLASGQRAVIFGGLQPTGGFTAGASTSTFIDHASLGLTDSAAQIQVVRVDSVRIDSVVWGTGQAITSLSSTCASYTRVPEGTGDFKLHTDATAANNVGILWSPGVPALSAIPKVNAAMSVPAGASVGITVGGPYVVQFNMAMAGGDLTAVDGNGAPVNVHLYASSCTAPANEVTAVTVTGLTSLSGTGASAVPYIDRANIALQTGTSLAPNTLHCIKVSGAVHSASSAASAMGSDWQYEFTTGAAP